MVHHGTTHIGTTTIIKFPGPVRSNSHTLLFLRFKIYSTARIFQVLFYSGFGVSWRATAKDD